MPADSREGRTATGSSGLPGGPRRMCPNLLVHRLKHPYPVADIYFSRTRRVIGQLIHDPFAVGVSPVRKFITNGHKLISRLDRDIGVLIDNCLGFLYSMDLEQEVSQEICRIETALYDMVYLGRTPAGHEFKESLFRNRILPIMKRLSPAGYYFGIDPQQNGLLGYWREDDRASDPPAPDSMPAADERGPVASDSRVVD